MCACICWLLFVCVLILLSHQPAQSHPYRKDTCGHAWFREGAQLEGTGMNVRLCERTSNRTQLGVHVRALVQVGVVFMCVGYV